MRCAVMDMSPVGITVSCCPICAVCATSAPSGAYSDAALCHAGASGGDFLRHLSRGHHSSSAVCLTQAKVGCRQRLLASRSAGARRLTVGCVRAVLSTRTSRLAATTLMHVQRMLPRARQKHGSGLARTDRDYPTFMRSSRPRSDRLSTRGVPDGGRACALAGGKHRTR